MFHHYWLVFFRTLEREILFIGRKVAMNEMKATLRPKAIEAREHGQQLSMLGCWALNDKNPAH